MNKLSRTLCRSTLSRKLISNQGLHKSSLHVNVKFQRIIFLAGTAVLLNQTQCQGNVNSSFLKSSGEMIN